MSAWPECPDVSPAAPNPNGVTTTNIGTSIAAVISRPSHQACPLKSIHTTIETDMDTPIKPYSASGLEYPGGSPKAPTVTPNIIIPTIIAAIISRRWRAKRHPELARLDHQPSPGEAAPSNRPCMPVTDECAAF
jgi:hypothetical protein